MISFCLHYRLFCFIYHILNTIVRFLNYKYDLGARFRKSYLFDRLRKLFIIPIKINFDETKNASKSEIYNIILRLI
jgi:hypothetical protein